MSEIKYVTPSGLAHYDEKIKEFIDGKDKLKGDTLYYDEDKSELQLKSGENVLSAVTIIGGGSTIDISADFLNEGGFGNLRYYNGHFQYYNKATSTWVDTTATPSNVLVVQMRPNPMKKFIGIYDIDLRVNKLKFEEPSDTIMKNSAGEDEAVCVVESVVIRRKLGSMPVDETDGDFVVEIERKDFGKYKKEWFIDGTITPNLGDVYCYKAFPMSTTGFYNKSSENEKSILCKDYYLYGFKLDQNESDPLSMITYLKDCDNVNFDSAYMNYLTDMFDYGDWKDAWFIKNLKPCMLNYDGTVAYELDKNDYSLKADGTASDIANDAFEGNAMVGVPKVYWKIVDNGDNTANIYFSNKKVDEDFVCWSHIDNNGNEIAYCYMPIYNGSNVSSKLRSLSGKTTINSQTAATEITLAKANNLTSDIVWYTEVFSDRMLINLLLLLIGKSTDTQTIFGNGHYTGNNVINSGTMNNNGLFYGTNGTGKCVKVFGMEHWWGNQWRRVAGLINYYGTQKIKLTYGQSDGSTVDGYNTDGTGYIVIPNSTPNPGNGYISKVLFNENGLIPTTNRGSQTTYYCDGLWANNEGISYPIVGGGSSFEHPVGAFCLSLNDSNSVARQDIVASLSCKPLA